MQEVYAALLLTRDLRVIEPLKGFTGGVVTGNIHADIRFGATISLKNPGIQGTSWNQYRIKLLHYSYPAGGEAQISSIGVFTVVGEKIIDQGEEGGITSELTLCDLTVIVRDAKPASTLTFNTSTPIRDLVLGVIDQTGLVKATMVDTPDRLRSPLVFPPETSYLKIVNTLLDSAGFFALYAGTDGILKAEKYLPPSMRPIRYHFDPSVEAKHLPEKTWEEQIVKPNEIVCVSTSTSSAPGLIAVARNQLPDSPYSFQNQGRWVTETHTGVEASSQNVLQEHANRRLDIYLAGKVYQRKLAYTPLQLNDVVAQNGQREVIENITIRLTPGELMEVTSRQVKN